jgi:hypothetical protein
MAKTVEHSPKFETVQTFYTRGAWSIDKVRNAVVKSWITAEEFGEITGEQYE